MTKAILDCFCQGINQISMLLSHPSVVMVTMVYQKASGMLVKGVSGVFFSQ